jgi:cytochrome P450
MSNYAEALTKDDPRIKKIFDVEAETHDLGAVMIDDPFPAFAELLAKAPVHKGALADLMGYDSSKGGFANHFPGRDSYTCLSFAAVSRALIENKVFSSHVYNLGGGTQFLGDTILNNIGQKHRMYRDPIQPMFSPDMAATWWSEKIIDDTVEALIGMIEKKKEADLFLELCARMPVHVVSGGFGLDPDEIIDFRIALLESMRHTASVDERMAASANTKEILRRVIHARRKDPKNDIISRMVETEMELEDGTSRPFTDDEIINHCRLIVLAGGGTTWRQLGITIFALLNNPEQLELLRNDRSLMPRVVLESARWHSTDLVFPRMASEDIEIEGVTIPKDAIIHVTLGAANRDPSRWENPDKFDIMRPVQRGVAFGAGPHSCLGQHVSRQEMVVAMNAILDRLPNVRWDTSKPPAKLVGGLFQRGPMALPVVFG